MFFVYSSLICEYVYVAMPVCSHSDRSVAFSALRAYAISGEQLRIALLVLVLLIPQALFPLVSQQGSNITAT